MSFAPTERKGPRGPLSSVRVLDLSAYIAGPYGCSLLADQGAEVVKIEPPAGDNLRKYPSTLEAESRAFLGVNRSKWGMVLDLKQEADHAVLMKLVREADVLVHNFRPGVPERLGIGFGQLSVMNPRLIYCSVTGYGSSGPLKAKAGYDQVLQTMTGMCAMQGKAGGPPEILYGSVVDYYASALVAGGVASALYEREKSGLGQHVGVSLLRAALTMQSARLVWAEGEPREVGRDMRSGASRACIRRGRATSISRPIRSISGRRCAPGPACTTSPPTSATTRCASAPCTRTSSFPGCARRWPRTRRLNGRPSSARKSLARQHARWRTCSTTRRCRPRT